jgi:hypothetical protein
MENSPSKLSSHANSVSSQPSAARPTVIHERGKLSFRSTNAGRTAHAVARRKSTNADVTLLESKPLRLNPKKSSPRVNHGKNARTKKSSVAAAMT